MTRCKTQRTALAFDYATALQPLVDDFGLQLPCADGSGAGGSRGWFVYVVQLPVGGPDRDDVIRLLKDQGVASKPYLPAIHLMSFYRERFGLRKGMFPVAESVAERSLALPFFPEMSAGQVEQVVAALTAALRS
ncbi:MAG TPA: DegT/DnrJ/EryC1/StrS family aminotransferase [Baekduia sp.]|nr:DegT/DnrJ/EryC1/StrS family aminotransferase [Baekduia sp.]